MAHAPRQSRNVPPWFILMKYRFPPVRARYRIVPANKVTMTPSGAVICDVVWFVDGFAGVVFRPGTGGVDGPGAGAGVGDWDGVLAGSGIVSGSGVGIANPGVLAAGGNAAVLGLGVAVDGVGVTAAKVFTATAFAAGVFVAAGSATLRGTVADDSATELDELLCGGGGAWRYLALHVRDGRGAASRRRKRLGGPSLLIVERCLVTALGTLDGRVVGACDEVAMAALGCFHDAVGTFIGLVVILSTAAFTIRLSSVS